MAVPVTPFTQPASSVPYVPTGYESLSADIQRKRAIADSLLNQQASQNMQSPLQALAEMANAWAGKHLEKKADEQQADMDWQRQQQAQQVQQQISDALTKGAQPADIVNQFGSNPMTANIPIVKAMTEAYTKQLGNSTEVDGAPVQLRQPDGSIKSFMRMKDGSMKAIDQGTVANEMKLGPSGQVYDPMAIKAGTNLPDVSKEVYLGADGKPVLNQPLIGAKENIARAGKTTVNTSTYVNAMDKSFGKQIPEAVVNELTSNRSAGMSYLQSRPDLDRAERALKSGMINGFGASARLDIARAADMFGITGKTQRERIANTQIFMQGMGKQILPIIEKMKPASDTDVKTANLMAGGDINLSTGAMLSAIRSAKQAGHQAVQNTRSRVKELSATFGRDPDIANGLKSFDIAETPGEKAQRILAQRRGK